MHSIHLDATTHFNAKFKLTCGYAADGTSGALMRYVSSGIFTNADIVLHKMRGADIVPSSPWTWRYITIHGQVCRGACVREVCAIRWRRLSPAFHHRGCSAGRAALADPSRSHNTRFAFRVGTCVAAGMFFVLLRVVQTSGGTILNFALRFRILCAFLAPRPS